MLVFAKIVVLEGKCMFCILSKIFYFERVCNLLSYLLLRFINDPRCDSCVNAKIKYVDNTGFGDEYFFPPDIAHSRYYIVAETDIDEGDEIFISYGQAYWQKRWNSISLDMQNNICSFNCMLST